MKRKILLILTTITLLWNIPSTAQTCCGAEYCVGLVLYSGVFGGYGIQQYSAEGLNDYIKYYNNKRTATLTKKMDEFGLAKGYTIGGKFFQYEISRLLFSMKFIFSKMNEMNYATASTGKREYDLTLTTWGFGMGFSKVLNRHFDFKIADMYMTFNNAKFVNRFKSSTNSSLNTEQELKNSEAAIGGMITTGIVYYPLPPFISFELNAGYSYFSIGEMEFSNGYTKLAKNEDSNVAMDNFASGGGFFANLMLQIAIPFDKF